MTIYPKIIHNGRFIDKAEATLPVYTPAMVGALGVYETILARHGKYVALDEHLTRLQASAQGAELVLDIDLATLRQWSFLVVAANHADGLVRVLALDLGRPSADVYLYQMSYTAPAPEAYEQGVAVGVFHGERAMPLVKSFNTLVPGLARKAALAAGLHDALLVDRDGAITEGSNCNVFAVIAGALVVPPVGAVLEGTVMTRTLALAQALGIPVERRAMPLAEVPAWDEAFLTSTRRGVLPVSRVGEEIIGEPGPITQKLMAAYRAWETEELGE
jgi:branched-subunit amino acid aminotransferase/4-amino-4-deoxychorismate lyase